MNHPAPAFSPQRYVPFQKAKNLLPTSDGKRFTELFRHGTLQVEIFAPRLRDTQQPHTRDELYVVAEGSGWFVNGDRRWPFLAGDVLFAAAGEVHRFEDFSDDLWLWVIFYGPEGGERSTR